MSLAAGKYYIPAKLTTKSVMYGYMTGMTEMKGGDQK